MGKLIVFNQVSLDGFIADANGDMSWAHQDDAEWNEFVAGNASHGSQLVLGRVTYEMMASFWPTPQALASMPAVAERMNMMTKILFSRTLHEASWQNTMLVKGDIATEMRRIKETSKADMTILGSGSIVSQLSQAGLIDEYQIIINPVVLGQGKSMFETVQKPLNLTQTKTRTFGNGNVLLCYETAV
jgi:dihydrofolate reductase